MANFYQEDVLVLNADYEYNLGGWLLEVRGQEEPMELDDGILDQEESADPAEEEPSMLGWGATTSLSKMLQPHLLSPPYTGCHNFLQTSTLQPRRNILETALHALQLQRLPCNPMIWYRLIKLSRRILHTLS